MERKDQNFEGYTCRGVLYLHSADPPIVHQDIKSLVALAKSGVHVCISHNILIDGQLSAKICDFGFAIELPNIAVQCSLQSVSHVLRVITHLN